MKYVKLIILYEFVCNFDKKKLEIKYDIGFIFVKLYCKNRLFIDLWYIILVC